MVTLTEQDEGEVEFDLVEELAPEFKPGERAEYVQLLFQDGTVLSKSTSLGATRLDYDAIEVEPSFADLTLPDGRPGRMVTFRFIPIDDSADDDSSDDESADDASSDDDSSAAAEAGNGGQTGLLLADSGDGDPGADREIWIDLALAQGKEPLANLLATMRTTLLLSFLLLMALLAVLARFSIHAGLRPLREMASEVESIGASNLDRRLATGTGTRELSPITGRLNELLERLEEAFEREKRFSGNVAHELRTPIAELRALAEVGREWPSEEEMVAGFFGDLIDVADDMERTVVNLLMLARLDAGTQDVKRETFDLSELVANVCDRFEEQASENGLHLDNRIQEPLEVSTDKDKLKLILVNLVYNAISYSPTGTAVVIETNGHGGELELMVSNEAVDLSADDVGQMFERFWRKDQARTTGSHAGLGLSLVKALSELLGLKVKPALDGGSRFSLSLQGLAPA
jgi:signal transduction histidine kinase